VFFQPSFASNERAVWRQVVGAVWGDSARRLPRAMSIVFLPASQTTSHVHEGKAPVVEAGSQVEGVAERSGRLFSSSPIKQRRQPGSAMGLKVGNLLPLAAWH